MLAVAIAGGEAGDSRFRIPWSAKAWVGVEATRFVNPADQADACASSVAIASTMALPALVPSIAAESDDEVALHDEDIAFCHIASAGSEDWFPCSFIASCSAHSLVVLRVS